MTADTLTQEIFNFPARRQRAVKCKMALTSQQRSWCVLEFHKTLLWVCSVLSNSNLMWIRLLTSLFWSGTGFSLKVDAPVIRERDIQADRRLGTSQRIFLRSPKKSTRRASRELKVPQSTVSKVLRKRLRLYTLTSCNWSKSYTRKTRKRDMHFAGISKR